MQYRIHDAPTDLWAWVKSEAHLSGMTLNDFVLYILENAKRQKPTNTRKTEKKQYTGGN
jgi:hypothetical protein